MLVFYLPIIIFEANANKRLRGATRPSYSRWASSARRSRGSCRSDPQTLAAVKLVSWVSAGTFSPSDNDVGMLRLSHKLFADNRFGAIA
jgi:hypothetical protein